ncbi:MAG: LacI family transcriptional regulator [Victivallaceae bacterium]|nr:LacI family transcriptional regulator [Victivallaceae bacterium]
MSSAVLYKRITGDIKELIDGGSLSPGAKIPSVNILKGKYGVSHITAMKVYQELSKDNYVTQKRGRGYFVRDAESFKQVKRTGNIGNFIRPLREYCLEDNYFNDINSGIQAASCEQRLNLLSSHSTLPLNHPPVNKVALEHIAKAMLDCADEVDGYLVDERISDEIIASMQRQTGKPMVIINRLTDLAIDSVTPPNCLGVRQALDVALRMGYSQFIFTRPGNRVSNNIDRYDTFIQFLKDSGISENSFRIVDDCSILPGEITIKRVITAINELKTQGQLLLFCCGDTFARNCCNMLIEDNLIPGKGIGLLSGDGFGYSKRFKPEIAALQSQPFEMGKLAVKALISRLSPDNYNKPRNITPEPAFTFGETL